MGILWNENSPKSNGGTEQICRKIERDLPKDLLDQFQLVPSRLRGELDESKIRLFLAHDLPGDPESDHLKNGGWSKYHRLVFVSHWQREWYVRHYNIPYSKTALMQNAIQPIDSTQSLDDGKVKLIYHTTPHRGLELLVPVFEKLSEKHKDIHLDIYSSFNLYGWGERDGAYKVLFDRIKDHEQMTYHGAVDAEEVRAAVGKAHIFAYPSIWYETSCMCLMEAMSAGCYCVHPDYGALPETAANWTFQYAWHEDKSKHAGAFYNALDIIIDLVKEKDSSIETKIKGQKSYADLFYNWDFRKGQWEAFLTSLLNEPRAFEKSDKEMFVYKPFG